MSIVVLMMMSISTPCPAAFAGSIANPSSATAGAPTNPNVSTPQGATNSASKTASMKPVNISVASSPESDFDYTVNTGIYGCGTYITAYK